MTKQTLLRRVLEKLAGATNYRPKERGGKYLARCPAHDDHSPSLSVSLGDEGVVLYCHTGCDFARIAKAIGMDPSDLFYASASPDPDAPPLPPMQQLAETRGWTVTAMQALGAEAIETEHQGPDEVHFPMWDADGEIRGWRKRRADNTPYSMRSGSTPKVLTVSGGHNGAFVTAGLGDREDVVLVTEGEADAVAAITHGAESVLGTPGATPGRKTIQYAQELIGGRTVVLCPDPDAASERWKQMLGRALHFANCDVKFIPPVDTDLDDRLRAADDPEGELRHLIDHAQVWTPRNSDPIEATATKVAHAFISHAGEIRTDARLHDGKRHLVYYDGDFFEWTGRGYRQVAEGDLEARITRFIDNRDWIDRNGDVTEYSPSRAFVRNVTGIIRGEGLVPAHLQPPVWIDSSEEVNGLLGLNNCMLDVRGSYKNMIVRETGEWVTQDHTPELFATRHLNYDFDPEAECPRWFEFLDQVLPDEAAQEVLARWAGYLLIPSQAYQKILLMTGEGGNGKGVITEVLEHLIGPDVCAGVALEQLHKPHTLSALEGMLANFATEWGYLDQVGLDVLKKLSGGDKVNVNRKYKDLENMRLPARFTISCNEEPNIRDRSRAIWRRLMVMPFEVEIPEEDQIPKPTLVKRLTKELPGIFRWALCGLFALWDEDGFNVPEEMQAAASDLRQGSNPAAIWCEEALHIQDNAQLILNYAYQDYKGWCKASNHKPLAKNRFSKELRRWYRRETGEEPPNRQPKRKRIDDGKRSKIIHGIYRDEESF